MDLEEERKKKKLRERYTRRVAEAKISYENQSGDCLGNYEISRKALESAEADLYEIDNPTSSTCLIS